MTNCLTCGYSINVCQECGKCPDCAGCNHGGARVVMTGEVYAALRKSNLRLLNKRGEIGLQLCLLALAAFFAFHIGVFVARQGEGLIHFILKSAGL